MKISLVPMRALPGSAAAGHRAAPVRLMTLVPPTPGQSALATPPCPRGVELSSWSLLTLCIDDAQNGTPIANATLRATVRRVVRELRAADQSWESVYDALGAAVVPVAGAPLVPPADQEVYQSRSAAIVAHLHCWADVDRLEEIEREDGAG